MINFKIVKHGMRDCEVVEIYDDSQFIGSLYPAPEKTRMVQLLSRYTRAGQHLIAFQPEPVHTDDSLSAVVLRNLLL